MLSRFDTRISRLDRLSRRVGADHVLVVEEIVVVDRVEARRLLALVQAQPTGGLARRVEHTRIADADRG